MNGKHRIQKTEDAVLAKVEWWCYVRVMQVAWDKKNSRLSLQRTITGCHITVSVFWLR